MASSTTSPKSTASSGVTARAPCPISSTRSFSESGPREFAIATSCPAAANSFAAVPPMLPEPMTPIRTPRTLLPVLGQPVAELLAHVGDRLPGVLERAADPVRVVHARLIGLLAQGVLLPAADVVAADDAVVVPLAHPAEELVHTAHRQRVGEVQLEQEAREAVHTPTPLRVVGGLRDERVEVEVGGGLAGGDRHQRAADGHRVARGERRGAVAAELCGAEPLEQGG